MKCNCLKIKVNFIIIILLYCVLLKKVFNIIFLMSFEFLRNCNSKLSSNKAFSTNNIFLLFYAHFTYCNYVTMTNEQIFNCVLKLNLFISLLV